MLQPTRVTLQCIVCDDEAEQLLEALISCLQRQDVSQTMLRTSVRLLPEGELADTAEEALATQVEIRDRLESVLELYDGDVRSDLGALNDDLLRRQHHVS